MKLAQINVIFWRWRLYQVLNKNLKISFQDYKLEDMFLTTITNLHSYNVSIYVSIYLESTDWLIYRLSPSTLTCVNTQGRPSSKSNAFNETYLKHMPRELTDLIDDRFLIRRSCCPTEAKSWEYLSGLQCSPVRACCRSTMLTGQSMLSVYLMHSC